MLCDAATLAGARLIQGTILGPDDLNMNSKEYAAVITLILNALGRTAEVFDFRICNTLYVFYLAT
jgi:hypothetical protein